jgi:hypothetical protein
VEEAIIVFFLPSLLDGHAAWIWIMVGSMMGANDRVQ